MAASRRDPPRLRRRRNRWRVRQRICLGTCPTGKGAELVHVPAAVHVVRIGLPARVGTRPDSIDHATARYDAGALARFLVHVSCQQALAATATFPRSAASAFKRHECCIVQLQLNAGLANRRRPGATSQENRTQDTLTPSAPRSGCTGPAGTPWNPGSSAFKRRETPDPVRPAGVWLAGIRLASGWLAGGLAVWPLTRSSRPGRSPPRRPYACPGGGSGTGRTAGLRHPGPPSRR